MRAVKAFDYSINGIVPIHLEPGDDASGVPAAYVPGLIAEGFIEPGDVETKVIEAAPETGDKLLLTETEIHADLEGAGVEFDPRDDLAAKTALRDEARAARAGSKAKKA